MYNTRFGPFITFKKGDRFPVTGIRFCINHGDDNRATRLFPWNTLVLNSNDSGMITDIEGIRMIDIIEDGQRIPDLFLGPQTP